MTPPRTVTITVDGKPALYVWRCKCPRGINWMTRTGASPPRYPHIDLTPLYPPTPEQGAMIRALFPAPRPWWAFWRKG